MHIGDLTSANKELEILNSLRAQLLNIDDAYKANQVNIQITTVNAWIEFKKANSEKAIELMKEAVQMENSTTKHPVTPGEVLPAGELLGDMYLAMKRPSDALAVYESDLKIHPNRFNSLYGAALSAKEIGDNKKAAQYFGILLEQSKPFESDRSELLVAKEYLNKMGLMVMG